MPRPGSRVIAAGWEALHRPVAEATFTATITFKRPSGTPVFDSTKGETTQPTITIYSGPCRIQELQREHTTIAAAERISIRRYQVSLTIAATGLRLDDVGTVDAASDTSLIGRGLRIIDVQRGSLMFQRDLICTDNLEV